MVLYKTMWRKQGLATWSQQNPGDPEEDDFHQTLPKQNKIIVSAGRTQEYISKGTQYPSEFDKKIWKLNQGGLSGAPMPPPLPL